MQKALILFLASCALMARNLEQEATAFLEQWLVDGEVQKALRHVSDSGPFCVPNLETGERGLVTRAEARERLREGMAVVLKTLGRQTRLSSVVGPVPANLGYMAGRSHTGIQLFSVWDVSERDLRIATCDSPTKRAHGVIAFVFRGPKEDEPAGGMYVVFERHFPRWRIVGFGTLRL